VAVVELGAAGVAGVAHFDQVLAVSVERAGEPAVGADAGGVVQREQLLSSGVQQPHNRIELRPEPRRNDLDRHALPLLSREPVVI